VSPFPALDPEPEPRPFWRTALIPTAVAAGVAVVVVLAITLSGGGSSPKAAAAHVTWVNKLPGEVVGWNSTAHTLLAMSPTAQLHEPALLLTQVNNYPPVSPTGFGLLTSPGHVSYLENGAVTAGPPPYPGAIHAGDVYGLSPFAAHDNALAFGGLAPTGMSQTPVVFDVNNSDRHSLPGAIADQVVGDPATMGAWVTVVSGALPAGNFFDPEQADVRVEYRTPHKPPVVLATTAQLRQLTGFKGRNGLHLTVYPSPSGRQIVVDVFDSGKNQPAPEELVVFTRTGQVVSKLSVPGLSQVAWSTSGGQMLIVRSNTELLTWTPGSAASAPSHLPVEPQGWAACIYAPSGSYIVCGGYANEKVNKWAVLRLSDRAVVTEPTTAIPVDWVP
jgi:hypothetical protein